MKQRWVDIHLVIAITLITVVLALVLPSDWVSGRILVLPLVLLLPGYALTSALFPDRSLGVPERLVFSLSLSLVIVILGGLALNWTPWGLRIDSWAVLLGSITLGACAVVLVRRRQGLSTSEWSWAGNIGLTFRQGVLLGLAPLIICGAVAVSIIGAEQQPHSGFTQLWILPAGGANAKNTVRLGVSNMESRAIEYRLAVNVDGKVVKEWSSINLNPNKKWDAVLMLLQPGHTGAARVEADLYRADAPTAIYRHVVLWLGT